jgi:ribosome maturation factor RimP
MIRTSNPQEKVYLVSGNGRMPVFYFMRETEPVNTEKHNKHGSDKQRPQEHVSPLAPGRYDGFVSQVRDLADRLCQAEGLELVHVEFQRERSGRVLRLYLDKTGGVTLDDCVAFSRQISDLLDIEIESDDSYHLEVTSPGTDRPLGKAEDYERFKGHLARIKTRRPLAGRRNFKGTLQGISEGCVHLLIQGDKVSIPLQDVMKARLVDYNGENGCL